MNIESLSDQAGAIVRGQEKDHLTQLDTGEVIDAFKKAGAVLFRGFRLDVNDFEEFTNRFSDDYMDNKGSGSYRKTINPQGDGTIQSVSYSLGVDKQRSFGLPLHADRSYTKVQPPLMWFYCVKPANQEGETLLCDGERLCEALNPETRELFVTKRLKYIRHYPDGQWQVLYHTDDVDEVKKTCVENDLDYRFTEDNALHTEFKKSAIVASRWSDKPAFVNSILIVEWQEEDLGRTVSVVRLEDDTKIPKEVIDELKRKGSEWTVAIDWEPGDLIMIDNTRMMHGRNAFSDLEREIYVRMCRSVEW